MPRNTQNDFAVTEHTESNVGVRISVFSVCRAAASVCSVVKMKGDVLPQITQIRASPDTDRHRWAGLNQCTSVSRAASICVISGSRSTGEIDHRTHRTASPPQNTLKVLEEYRASVFSVFCVPRDAPQKTKFSEGRLRSNGEAARKGPRGFSVFSGENDEEALYHNRSLPRCMEAVM